MLSKFPNTGILYVTIITDYTVFTPGTAQHGTARFETAPSTRLYVHKFDQRPVNFDTLHGVHLLEIVVRINTRKRLALLAV